ncbi:MAG: gluconate 2-dehydrogenase subunit 3 family protein [Cytophagales bacterium]|nr:gluconate 2-dehydrogenase subunit 3 family protein [Cytophagales bacterium]
MNRRKAIQKTASLAGATALTPTLLSLLQSCQSNPTMDWTPAILNKDQARLVSALVDTLLPKTDTPGALELKVDQFIDLVIVNIFDEDGQQGMLTQLDAFNAKCQQEKDDLFADLSAEDRAEVLRKEERESPKYNGKIWGTAVGEQEPVGFYRSFKSLALWGYFSSEAIGKEVLSYDPIPGMYQGCIPLEDVGNTWSL